MHTIFPAVPANAEVIHDIQMRAFAEEGRLSGNLRIPPLAEEVADIELHIRTQTVLTARDGDRLTTNTLVPGNVPFYERRGYLVTDLTRYADKIVLAQMVKVARAAVASTTHGSGLPG